jgi:hypothetical protein
VPRCVQFFSEASSKGSLTDIVGLMPRGPLVSGLSPWINCQVARRARPHQVVPSTTQTLTKQSHFDPKPFLRRQSCRHRFLLQAVAISHQQRVEICFALVRMRPLSISCAESFVVILSELHLTRLCRTEPVAPALPCADLVGAASRRKDIRFYGWRPFIPSQ